MAVSATSPFWRRDWFLGLVITLLALGADHAGWLDNLERAAYDLGVRQSERPPNRDIALIAIDDVSIDNLGRWPWSRELHARLLTQLAEAQPKVIGHTVFFTEPQIDPGLRYLTRFQTFLNGSSLVVGAPEPAPEPEPAAPIKGGKKVERAPEPPPAPGLSAKQHDEVLRLREMFSEAVRVLNTDQLLANAVDKAGRVVLAMPFILGQPRGKPDAALPAYVTRHAVTGVMGEGLVPALKAMPPIAELGGRAVGIGFIDQTVDPDGGVRAAPLLLDYYGVPYPSLALLVAARSLNLDPARDLKLTPGEGVQLGNLRIQTDAHGRMLPFFHQGAGGAEAFARDSFHDIIAGKIPLAKYKDKIVLIGTTATGVGTTFPTPTSPAMAPVEILANTVASLLHQDYFVTPSWRWEARMAAFGFVGLVLVALLPWLRAGPAAILTLLLSGGGLGAELYLMTRQTTWLPLMGPLALLGSGYLFLVTKRFLVTEQGKIRSDAESAESNRMLGLAFQGQGQLDMAWEKFRKCPLDDSMLEVLYNLAIDFERKRLFGKAVAVYQYMSDFKPEFRDVAQRMKRSANLESTVVLGGAGNAAATTSLLSGDGEIQKPMLGRYLVEKELGKGAMGVVYQGRDPKINRVVAIKTMALSQEFEDEELAEVKTRFFREAESAGRLNHPNIVTIYDTGEEHDLAYIAMEFLKGRDLTGYIKKPELLPVGVVIQLIAKVAMALDYAHQQSVVHRDIKPANIMYDPETKAIKITDFGIARLTEGGRTKTKTGVVMGTPYYMSPEQISGKRVDGRSDIFSLGVMFYQLLTGQLPFYAKEMAALLYQITQEEPPPLTQVRPDLPPCLGQVAARCLAKDPEQRYQRAASMAKELVACVKGMVKG